jgi:transcriptional regulator with XRE-family HTH domain
MTPGENLRTKRLAQNLTQVALAEATGVDRTALSRFEHPTHPRRICGDAAFRLAEYFNCPIREFFIPRPKKHPR